MVMVIIICKIDGVKSMYMTLDTWILNCPLCFYLRKIVNTWSKSIQESNSSELMHCRGNNDVDLLLSFGVIEASKAIRFRLVS